MYKISTLEVISTSVKNLLVNDFMREISVKVLIVCIKILRKEFMAEDIKLCKKSIIELPVHPAAAKACMRASAALAGDIDIVFTATNNRNHQF